MGIVILQNKASKKDIKLARKEYPNYIKITVDLEQKVVAIGGEYHADAEKILLEQYQSQQKNLWAGGYNIETKTFDTNALINMRSQDNPSSEVLDPNTREKILALVNDVLENIESLLE